MLDFFREEVVTKKNRSMETVMYVLANILMVASGIYGIFMANLMISVISMHGFSPRMILDIVIVLLMIGAAVLIYLFKDRVRTEYEYTFTNGTMDFAQVFNNKKRKALGTMNVRNVEACGYVSSGSFRRYLSMPGISRVNWFLNRDANLFFFYFVKDSKKTLLILEPTEAMVDLIKKFVGAGKFQVN